MEEQGKRSGKGARIDGESRKGEREMEMVGRKAVRRDGGREGGQVRRRRTGKGRCKVGQKTGKGWEEGL